MKPTGKPLVHHLHDYFFPHARNNYRPHLFSLASVAVLVFAIVIFEAGYLVQTKFVFLKTDFLAAVLPSALIALTNHDRGEQGLAHVDEDLLLNKAAQAAAEDMAAKGYFAHNSPDGKTPWYWLEQAGYRYSYAGQNLAVNFTDSELVETAWMNSPTHRANIVKPQYTKIGIGTANGVYNGRETTFVVQFFATPPASAAPADVALAPAPVAIEAPTPTTPTTVLGSETVNADTGNTPAPQSWFAVLLSSPLHTLLTLLLTLFALIAGSFTIALLVRIKKMQHPSVVFGGAFLLVLISGATLFSMGIAGPVQLNTQAAAVSAVLP